MSATTYFFKWLGLIFCNSGKNKGIGDLLFRSALFAMARRDYRLLFSCYILIKQRKRWPDSLGIPIAEEHRNQNRMTRDPYWVFWAASYLMNKPHYIEATPPPWYIWRPHFMAWRQYLLTRDKKYKRRYEFWHRVGTFFSFGRKPAFAVFLDCLAAWVADSAKVQVRLFKHIPEWNLCCRQMVLHPNWLKDEDKITAYLPREGFLWQAEEYYDNRKLPLDQEYYLDKEALWFFWMENLKKYDIV